MNRAQQLTEAQLEEAGLYDPQAVDAPGRLALLRFNLEHGVTIEELIEADREGRLALVAGERALRAGGGRLSLLELAERSGIPVEEVAGILHAGGLPRADPDIPMFDQDVVEVLAVAGAAKELFGQEVTLQLARVLGSSLARMAEAEISAFASNVGEALVEEGNELALAEASFQASLLLPHLARALEVMHRHHVEAAIRRVGLVAQDTGLQKAKYRGVGFMDLVGFTALSQQLAASELGEAVAEFEAQVDDVVGGGGGRVVKLIGDEVMFVTPDGAAACEIALSLVERFADHPVLPSVRGGLATGDMVTQDGDYYGPVVNLASRLVKVGPPDAVLAPDELRREVVAEAFRFDPMGAHSLKGFPEPVSVYRLQRAS